MTMENLVSQQQPQLERHRTQQHLRHIKPQQQVQLQLIHNNKQQPKRLNSGQLLLKGGNAIVQPLVTYPTSGVIKVVTSSTRPIIHNIMKNSAVANSEKNLSLTSISSSIKSNSNVTSNPRVLAVASPSLNRRCIFGCVAETATLCRFPVHDQKRCNNWLKFFKVDVDRVHTHGGLANLRVCLKHFNETQQMAKTRIKTTPTRLQKDAMLFAATTTTTTSTATLTAATTLATGATKANAAQSLATTTATSKFITNVYSDEVKKRLRHPISLKEPLHTTSTIIVAAPKRTNSISSATSTISHASDTQSMHSDNESPPPPPLARATIPKTLNSLLCKSSVQSGAASASVSASAAAALKNRKVFMITEKCDNLNIKSESATTATGGAQKRKMYLIMEESTAQNGDTQSSDAPGIDTTKCMKFTENNNAIAAKKLTLFADKSDGELSQKFEKILPEILNCIQATKVSPVPKQISSNGIGTSVEAKILNAEAPTLNERLPLTLPPKKNRTKIVHTHAAAFSNGHNNNSNSTNTNINNNNGNGSDEHIIYYPSESQLLSQQQQQQQAQKQTKQISAAIPVIVSAPSYATSSLSSSTPSVMSHSNGKSESTMLQLQSQAQLSTTQKNINLSTDFLFLMKMLPKLESIPEPHKNHVKNCIERIIMQNAASMIRNDNY